MRAVVQRVQSAAVTVEGRRAGAIPNGLLVYLGVGRADEERDARYMSDKLLGLRIFMDDAGKMNLSVRDVGGGLLVVSQFTLYGDAREGRRPSYTQAAEPKKARELYERTVGFLRESGLLVQTGEFQAHMEVTYTNLGPVTILLDSEKSF
ncbi:MAG TPA: D-aminoacyl-tRNA deacylase [Spirochaetia bacterium]|nr:D-aminoacyl-tRNA deacylase [Spirochaetia bacterium]